MEDNFWNTNNENFSSVEFDTQIDFETRYIKPPKSKEMQTDNLKYNDAVRLAENLVIDENNRYFVLINGSFIFGDFIEALIKKNNYHVEQLTISTLSMNDDNVDSLANLLKGNYVDELNLIISGFHYSYKRHTIVAYTYRELDLDNKFQLAVSDCHTKICLIKTHCGKNIVIHGSANLCSSGCIEQIVVEESKELYDFNVDYHNKIIEKFKTIEKPIRGKKLWETINS